MSRDIAGVWIFEHWDMIVISILFMFICIEAHETRNNERLLLLALCLLCTKCFFRKSESQDGWSYSNYVPLFAWLNNGQALIICDGH